MAKKVTVDPATLARIGAFSKQNIAPKVTAAGLKNTFSSAQLDALASAFAKTSSSSSSDYLNSAQAKLAQSIANINNSNAPMGNKLAATGEAVGQKKGSKSFFDRMGQVLSLPLTTVTSSIARIVDPKRNFLKDIRSGVTPPEIFATQDWYKQLPTVAKIGVGLGTSIALDPLTYLAGSGVISKLGGAAGISKLTEDAAIAARAAGSVDDAARLSNIAGNLVRKGQGGLGALDKAEMGWLSTQLETAGLIDKPLQGGLYWNVPGTGRIAGRLATATGFEAPELRQIYLGRPDWMRKISSTASDTLGGIKTSKVMREIGDKYGGGEGQIKRAILEAKTPQEALALRNVQNAGRIKSGAEAIYEINRAKSIADIEQRLITGNIDPVDLNNALGGSRAAAARVTAVDPSLVDDAKAFEASWKTASKEVGGRQLESLGIHPDQMMPLYGEDVALHQASKLTDEAIAEGVGQGKNWKNTGKGRTAGPDIRRRYDFGQTFNGRDLRHPDQYVTRIVDKEGNIIGVGVGRGKAGREAAMRDAQFEVLSDNRNVSEPTARYRVFDKKGRPSYKTAPETEFQFKTLAPDKAGRSVREQINAYNKADYGYELFDLNYISNQRRALNMYTGMHGEEVRAAYLRSRPTGNKNLDTILKDYPKSPAKARAAIENAADRLLTATSKAEDAYLNTIMVRSEGRIAIQEMNDRLVTAIEDMLAAARKTPKTSPKQAEYLAAVAELKNQHAALLGKIESLTERIAKGEVKAADLEAELAKLVPSNQTANAAAQNLATGSAAGAVAGAEPAVNPAVAEPVAPATGIKVDPELAMRQSNVSDLQVEIQDLEQAVKLGQGGKAAEKDLATARKALAKAEKDLAAYQSSMPAVAGVAEPTVAPVGVQPAAAVEPAMPVAPTSAVEPPVITQPQPNASELLANPENMQGLGRYTEDQIKSAIKSRNELEASIAAGKQEIDAARAARRGAAASRKVVQGEGAAVIDAREAVAAAAEEFKIASAGKNAKAASAAGKRLDKARAALKNAEAERAAFVQSTIESASGDTAAITRMEAKVAKDEAALQQLKRDNPYLNKGFTGTEPETVMYSAPKGVTYESVMADLPAERQARIVDLQQNNRLAAADVPEVVARQDAYEISKNAVQTLKEIGASPEQIAVAEWQMQGALRDMQAAENKGFYEYMDNLRAQDAANRVSADPRLGTAGRSWVAEPPEGGYSPEWDMATLQYFDDTQAVRSELETAITDKTVKMRKARNAARNAELKGKPAKGDWRAMNSELEGLAKTEKLVAKLDARAGAATEAALEERLAFGRMTQALDDAEKQSAAFANNFGDNPNLNPRFLEFKRRYESAALKTVKAAQLSEDSATVARFAATTNGLSEDQVVRLIDSIDNAETDAVIRQVTRELGMEPAQQQVVSNAAKQIGNDPAAIQAVTTNANDPVVVQQVTKASKGKQAAAAQMGGEPGSVVVGTKAKRMSAKTRQKINDLREEITKVAKGQKRLTREQTNKLAELDVIEANIKGYSKKIDAIEKQKRAMFQNNLNEKVDTVNEARKLRLDELNRGQRALEIAMAAEENSLKRLAKASDNYEYQVWLKGPKADEAVRYIVRKGFAEISRSSQSPMDIADAMAMMTRLSAPNELPSFMKYFDKMTRLFKSWAIATPGFIARNGYSGIFMNYLFDVNPGSMQNFLKADRIFRSAVESGMSVPKALEEIPDNLRQAYSLVHNSGVLELGGQVQNTLADLKKITGSGAKRGVLTALADTPINRATYNVNRDMERALRGASAMHAADSGRGIEGIYDLVFKAHFDYGDLNNFENSVMKRISPFYTWFRKNLPTQMEMVFRNPKAFARYVETKDAIEAASSPEDLLPSWMTDRMNIRLPFSLPGGQMYVMPDMPIKDLNVLGNWNDLLGQINPVIKTPVEMAMDSKMYFGQSAPFQGLVQVPDTYEKVGLGSAMEMLGFAERDANGNLMAQDKYLYAMEQFFPLMGRARRLLPDEPRYQDRLPVTVLNTLFGLSLRANTQSDKYGEVKYRQKKIDQMAEDLQKLGYGGYDYWQKQVALASKPTATDKRPYLTLLQPKGGLPTGSPFTNVASTKKVDWSAIAQMLSGQK